MTGPGIDGTADRSESYSAASNVTLTLLPRAGQRVLGWDGCDQAGGDQCLLTGTRARGFTARFESTSVDQHQLTVLREGASMAIDRTVPPTVS